MNSIEEKIVSKYTGLNFIEVDELECFDFWLYERDAVIYNHSQTDGGRDYLEQCWILEQDTPDRDKDVYKRQRTGFS